MSSWKHCNPFPSPSGVCAVCDLLHVVVDVLQVVESLLQLLHFRSGLRTPDGTEAGDSEQLQCGHVLSYQPRAWVV
jgi:hypothetical protein